MSTDERFIPERDESGAAYRRRRDNAAAFFNVVKTLIEADESGEPRNKEEALLDAVGRSGIGEVARVATEGLQAPRDLYIPADPIDVREYLANVHTLPPISIHDLGSVDIELVQELNLNADDFIEQIRALLGFANPEMSSLSVLDLPEIQRRMFSLEQVAFKKLITHYIMEMHGISFVFDKDDIKTWSDMYSLVNEICSEMYREYSRHLRKRQHEEKEKLPIFDVYDDMKDISEARDRAIALARENVGSTPHERRRLLEMLNPRIQVQIEAFFEALDLLGHESDEAKQSEGA